MTQFGDIKYWGRLFGACLILGTTITILQNNGVEILWWHSLLLGAGLGCVVLK